MCEPIAWRCTVEQWNDVDWVGTIRTYPLNEQFVDDLDDYDERRVEHGRAYDD